MEKEHDLAIFEAGISEQNEMNKLSNIIKADIGIMTNIGDAHQAGFDSIEQKLDEKLSLFESCAAVVYRADDQLISDHIQSKFGDQIKHVSWGTDDKASIRILSLDTQRDQTDIKLLFGQSIHSFSLPFVDAASVENAMHVIACCIYLEVDPDLISSKINELERIALRFQIEQGHDNCLLINDSYSADMSSLKLGLEYLEDIAQSREKVLILSQFDAQNRTEELDKKLAELIQEKQLSQLLFIGDDGDLRRMLNDKPVQFKQYNSTNELIEACPSFNNAAILIKGARKFKLERVFQFLAAQKHQTVLEINLSAIRNNINAYASLLEQETKIMAVIKASAYGSGSTEMASLLNSSAISYLAVAVADEAVELRKSGIEKPILVLNVQAHALDLLWEYKLEPEVFSMAQLDRLVAFAKIKNKPLGIHIKLDTGMRRLGFFENELPEIVSKLKEQKMLKVISVFSHLAAGSDADQDSFTISQFEAFEKYSQQLIQQLGYPVMRHILNSSGIVRFPDHQYDMVRLGLGMYGVGANDVVKLEKAHTLKTKILQVKDLEEGEATGYGRHARANTKMKIAIIGIGYADGLFRNSGNGNYAAMIGDQEVPFFGDVCMDVSILDVSRISNVKEGDELTIFGPHHPIEELAKTNGTIPYEILSRIAKRVKRIYIAD